MWLVKLLAGLALAFTSLKLLTAAVDELRAPLDAGSIKINDKRRAEFIEHERHRGVVLDAL